MLRMWHGRRGFESRAVGGPAIPGYPGAMSPMLRHIHACTNASLPGDRLPFQIGAAQVGWVRPAFADFLTTSPEIRRDPAGLTLADGTALPALARAAATAGFGRHRGEAFDVRATPAGPVLATIDRGALPEFGIMAQGVHMDVLVQRPDGPHLWIGRRAADKALDPGKLDHLVAGGTPAGLTLRETLVKEAAEEAGMQAALARRAVAVDRLGYTMTRPEGLRRDLLTCYELEVDDSFTPHAMDGEVAGFELWPLRRVVAAVRDTDAFKFNVNLVLMALFLRHGALDQPEAREVGAALARLRHREE